MLWLALAAATAPPGQAQAIRLDVEGAPLDAVLGAVRAQAGIDVVFARGLVQGHRVTCRYEGPRSEEALACALKGTGLQAERVRRKQYVIVAAPDGPPGAAPPPVRETLSGYVADAETGEMLPGAHVYLPVLQAGTTTNEAGYFVLPSLPRGTYPVRVSYLGYQARDTTFAPGGAAVQVELRPTTLQAGGVVVEAGRRDRALVAAAPGVLALPPGELERLPSFMGEQDLFRALQWRPGIRKVGGLGGGLSVRGGQTDQNLYLLDGAPVYHPWHAFSLISTFQSETLKDAQLYRSVFPAEHGGRLSAVLDAQMRDGSRDEPRATATLSALSGRFLVEGPLSPNTSFMVAGRRSYLDKLIGREHPVESDRGRRDTLRTGYYFYDMSAKLTTRPDDQHRVSLSYYHGRDDLDLRLPFDLSLDFSSWLRPSELLFEVGHAWENRLVSARHQYLPTDRLFVTTTAYYSGYRARERAFVRPTTSALLTSDYRVRLYDMGLKVDVNYHHSLAHEVRAGVQVVRRHFNSTLDALLRRGPGTVDEQEQASRQRALELTAYVQDEWRPTPRWTIAPGLRGSLFSSGRYVRLSPRLSAQYALWPERLVLRGAVDVHVQPMHRLRDRYALAYDLASSRWLPAGPTITPASSVQAALEAEARLASWLQLGLSSYGRLAERVLIPEDVHRQKDELEGPGIDVGALLGQHVPAQTRAWGVEAEARAEYGPWQAWLSYAYTRTLTRAAEERPYRPDRFDIPHAAQGALTYHGRRWVAALAAKLRSGYPTTVPVARYRLGDPLSEAPPTYLSRPSINNGRLPPYLRVDASLGYRFGLLGARWKALLHVYNATGRRNVISRQYVPAPETVEVRDRRGLPLLPLFELEVEL